MASVTLHIQILVALTCLSLFLYRWKKSKNSAITNWPIVGMLPDVIFNLKHIHDFITRILKASGGTLQFRGPWLSNMDIILTSDPMNINHVFNRSCSNYSKGPEFKDILEPLGDGIIAVDSDLWVFQRKMILKYFKDANFQLFLEKTVQEKVVNSLYPILDHACSQDMEVNMEDVIQRLGFDIVCLLILGCDPECLSLEFPEFGYERAISKMEEVALYRHAVPNKYWRLMRWLQLGEEKKLRIACNTYDHFLYQCITLKREEHLLSRSYKESDFDFLTFYLMEELTGERDNAPPNNPTNPNKFARDMATSLIFAGRDTSSATLSWFFWLLAKNPNAEDKIIEEITEHLDLKNEEKDGVRSIFNAQELNKLVYLHATICETLRLFPSVPFNHKVALQNDTLPSGHQVAVNTKIFISYYAMGRMEYVWGRDCLEFKPERWISATGQIINMPSYKFSAFGAGPRTCPGKDMSFVQMKITAVAILLKYQLQIVKDHPVEPCSSVILHMKHGLKVKVTERPHI